MSVSPIALCLLLLSCLQLQFAASQPVPLNTSDVMEFWEQGFGSVRTGGLQAVIFDSAIDPNDGTVVIVGADTGSLFSHTNLGARDGFVAKLLPSTGALVWVRWFSTTADDIAVGVCIDAAGNIVVSGSSGGTLQGQTAHGYLDHFVVRLTADGTQQWISLLGSSGYEFAGACGIDVFGSIFVVGETNGAYLSQNSASGWNLYVFQIAANSGSLIWGRNLGASSTSNQYLYNPNFNAVGATLPFSSVNSAGRGLSVMSPIANATSATILVISGYLDGAATYPDLPGSGLGGLDSFVTALYASNGTTLWALRIASNGDDVIQGMDVDSTGAVFICGGSNSNLDGNTLTGNVDVFVTKISLTGQKLWTRLYGGVSHDLATSCAVDNAGGLYVTGLTWMSIATTPIDNVPNIAAKIYPASNPSYTTWTVQAAFLSKFDSDGARLWTALYGAYFPSALGASYAPTVTPTSISIDQTNQQIYIVGRKSGYFQSDAVVSGISSTDIDSDQMFAVAAQQTPTNCTLQQFDSLLTQINSLLVGL